MGVSYSPKIVTDGLVLCLDAANVKSYPGTGTTYFDLSADKNNLEYQINNGLITYTNAGMQSFFERTILNGSADLYRSTSTIDLDAGTGFTFFALVYTDGPLHASTANGVLTNHSHAQNTGGGICLKYIDPNDFRISCNTGTGASRTYATYYGTTNIKGTWNLLAQRYDGTYNTLWVNGVKEHEVAYSMVTQSDYIDLFNWSTTHYTNASYRPKCKVNYASVYNKSLTDEEIKQNFNATRGRFGI